MYCKNCGKEIPESSKFCRYCGKNLGDNQRMDSLVEDGISTNHDKLEYAGFWIRLGAYSADLSGMFLISFLIGVVLYMLLEETTADSLIDNAPDFIYGYIAYAIYSTISLSIFSTTFGKYLYGLRVVNGKDEDLDFGDSLKRSLLQPLSTILFGIGYWNMGKNPKRQAWHDVKVNTAVVKKEKNLVLAYIVTCVAFILWAYLSYGLE